MRGSGRPVWEDTAPADDVRELDPGIPASLDPTPDVLVIGGGIVGLAVAVFCSRAGLGVVLVEEGRLANGPSGRAAGGLSPDAHPELAEGWRPLARASLDLHRALDAEWEYGLRSMDLLVPPDFRIPDQAHVDPVRLAAAFARHAGAVASGVRWTGWDVRDERVVSVDTTAGMISPGAVVVATGAADAEFCATNECLVKGHLIATEPSSFDLREIVVDGEILVVQLPDGRLVAGGTKDRDDDADSVDEDVVSRIEKRMVELVPEAAGLRRTHAWSCFRPCAPDEMPIIDRIPGLTNAWVATGLYSTGLLMAPSIGRVVAEWITRDTNEGLEGFTIARLGK